MYYYYAQNDMNLKGEEYFSFRRMFIKMLIETVDINIHQHSQIGL